MANKKRKSKSSGGRGGAGSGSGGGGGAGGGLGGGGGSNSHKRPRFYENAGSSSSNNDRNRHSRFSNDTDRSRGYYDPNTGQFGAFPGLEGDDDEFYGPANDGMDYLKMVRSEAKSVPTLLVAGQQYQVINPKPRPPPIQRSAEPTSDTLNYDEDIDTLNYDDESVPTLVRAEPIAEASALGSEYETNYTLEASTPDSAGWYHDGAYIAVPPPPTAKPPPTALSLWHTNLLTTFCTLRTSFHTIPYPSNPPPNLPPIPPSLPLWRQQQLWNTYILHTAPTPRTLRAMTQERVIRALEGLTHVPRVKKGVRGWWAEWVWGLLVRCEVCLTAEEVSVLRGIGKRALVVRKKLVCEGGWKEKKEEELESEWDGEEPEGWVEPEVKVEEEREDGEVEEGVCDETELEKAKRKAINNLTQASGEEREVETKHEANVAPGGNAHVNPDAGDLDGEPEAVITVSKYEVIEPVQSRHEVIQNDAKGPSNTDANSGVGPEVQAGLKTETRSELDLNANSEEINIEPIHLSPPHLPAPALTPSQHTPQTKKEHSLADMLGALDMAISIVGDFFGQRDLLDERDGQPTLSMY